MKALQNPVALATLLTLQACSMSATTPETPPQPTATLSNPTSIKPQTFVMRGQVVLGHEVSSITPCGSQQQYWLDLPRDRFNQGLTLVRAPYEPLYGEVIGHLAPAGKDGFASDYPARFVVDQVNLLSAENPNRCDRPLKSTHAFGTEPSWSVKFNQGELTFSQIGKPDQSLAITSSRIEMENRRYTFKRGNLELQQQSCVDGMSDSLYGWTSTFTLDNKTYHGCATLANQDATQDWVATYQAQAVKSNPFSVTLTLNPDHTAATVYRYPSGDADTVEKGYWQQLSPQQVQVVGTHLQGQPLLSERLYLRDGYQLSTQQEKVGDVVYDIANGGLTLFKTKATSSSETITNQRSLSADKIPSSDQYNPAIDKALREYFKQHKTDPTGTRYRWLTYDLNGDGNQELLAQLDWCGSGGCTLLVFESHQQKWRFNSRITLVQTPINLGKKTHHQWQDLVLFVSGGGAVPNQRVMQYDGISYPLNPSTAPTANYDEISQVQLFSDGLTPFQGGVTL
ncbi:hypothetical protein [Vibrio sinaloensis]|uniref:COG3650 family protein n=1 Tax=Photobacterium sp. (strain ATCC 43367) TaxID=379097 RepID=UPI002F42231C